MKKYLLFSLLIFSLVCREPLTGLELEDILRSKGFKIEESLELNITEKQRECLTQFMRHPISSEAEFFKRFPIRINKHVIEAMERGLKFLYISIHSYFLFRRQGIEEKAFIHFFYEAIFPKFEAHIDAFTDPENEEYSNQCIEFIRQQRSLQRVLEAKMRAEKFKNSLHEEERAFISTIVTQKQLDGLTDRAKEGLFFLCQKDRGNLTKILQNYESYFEYLKAHHLENVGKVQLFNNLASFLSDQNNKGKPFKFQSPLFKDFQKNKSLLACESQITRK